ncbi:hypothetical protein NKJ04_17380 [Mesorhizobium sp. M0618]|uniref:hypothetical protein n=1 Tax=Mesorhizobium sp. M0618 TaxID=2956972 RepID=UPI00333912D5
MVNIVHFVAFTEEQLRKWRCVFGDPGYIHERWDVRAHQEFLDGDTIIYANNTPRRIEDRAFFVGLSKD